MTEHLCDGITLQFTRGDIATQEDVDAVVNAANAELRTGGGVAGALHRAAGPGLAEECRPLAPIEPGQAVVTGGHGLPNAHVIHALGPVYGRDTPSDALLARAYHEALARAEEQELTSVAFPALSTGAFGYPMEEAARVALTTVRDALPTLERPDRKGGSTPGVHVRTIRFVLYDRGALALHERVAEEVFGHAS